VRHERTAAKERVDGTHRRARGEIERLVEDLASVPGPVKKRLFEVADTRVEQAVRTASDGKPHHDAPFRTMMGRIGLAFAVVVTFFLGIVAMGAGIGFAGAAVGAIALRGAWAPPVIGGLMMGVVGCFFGALGTDVLFARLGDWKAAVEDGLLGAISPLQGAGKPTPARDLANALKYVELPPLSPDRVTQPAASSALRVSLKDPTVTRDPGEVTGRIRIPARTKPQG
jgi:hypothetical protein